MNEPVKTGRDYGKVNELFGWPGSNYCAVVTWNSWLRLYDLKNKQFVQEFNIWDSGGLSAAVSADDRFLYLGAYYSWGLACIEIASRDFVWKRRDLKGFHGLAFSPRENCLYARFKRGSITKIDAGTGNTISNMPRVRGVSFSPFGDYVLVCGAKRLSLRNTAGITLHDWAAEGEVLAVTWSPRSIAIVDSVDLLVLEEKFGTRAYDLQSGVLLWRQPRKLTFPDGIMFKPENEYVAIEGRLGATTLVRFDEQSGTMTQAQIPADEVVCKVCGRGNDSMICCVCGDGTEIFCIDAYTHATRQFKIDDTSLQPI